MGKNDVRLFWQSVIDEHGVTEAVLLASERIQVAMGDIRPGTEPRKSLEGTCVLLEEIHAILERRDYLSRDIELMQEAQNEQS